MALSWLDPFPADRAPTLLDQVAVILDETALGLPASSADDVRQLVAELPFVPALALVARIALALWPIRNEPESHGDLAREVYGTSALVERLLEKQRAGSGEASHVLFSEQQLFVLARLLVESAGGAGSGWSQQDGIRFNRALFATTSVIGDGAAKIRRAGTRLADWLGFLTQNGAYNAYGPPIGAYVRTQRIYAELAATPDARAHDQWCDLEAWHRDVAGVGMQDLSAVGFAAAQHARMEHEDVNRRAVVPPMEHYLATTPLAAHHAAFTAALSASREDYAAGFARSHENPVRLAWEITPFVTKPFLRLRDGALVLVSARGEQWNEKCR